jgi:hypothetical protein
MIDAFTCNTTVKRVCFSGTFVRDLSTPDWCSMLHAVGYLSSLQDLQVWCSMIPVAVLARTLVLSHQIRKVYLFGIVLKGTYSDFRALAEALTDHPSLRDFRCAGFQLEMPTQEDPLPTLPDTPIVREATLDIDNDIDAIMAAVAAENMDSQPNSSATSPSSTPFALHQQTTAMSAAAAQVRASLHQNCVDDTTSMDDVDVDVDDDVDDDVMEQFTESESDIDDQPISMDPILEALATTMKLQVISLQLSGWRSEAVFSPSSLARMLSSESIEDMYLSRLGLNKIHFEVLAEGLRNNQTLKTLDLFGNHVDNDALMLIADALSTNQGLESLVLPCPPDDLSVEICEALSRALHVNTHLVSLTLPRSNLNDEGLYLMAQALTVNTTLKRIEVGISKSVSKHGLDALTKTLESNYGLQRLVISGAEKSVEDKVDYFMRLNEVGRGKLLCDGNATREQWVEMLISCSEDLDCLFYFIKMNPTLCQFANAQQSPAFVTYEVSSAVGAKRRHTFGGSAPNAKNEISRVRRHVQYLRYEYLGNGKNESVVRRASAYD